MVTEVQNIFSGNGQNKKNKILIFKSKNGYGINYINYITIYNLYVPYYVCYAPGSKT